MSFKQWIYWGEMSSLIHVKFIIWIFKYEFRLFELQNFYNAFYYGKLELTCLVTLFLIKANEIPQEEKELKEHNWLEEIWYGVASGLKKYNKKKVKYQYFLKRNSFFQIPLYNL